MLGSIWSLLALGTLLILIGGLASSMTWLLVLGILVFVGASAISYLKRRELTLTKR